MSYDAERNWQNYKLRCIKTTLERNTKEIKKRFSFSDVKRNCNILFDSFESSQDHLCEIYEKERKWEREKSEIEIATKYTNKCKKGITELQEDVRNLQDVSCCIAEAVNDLQQKRIEDLEHNNNNINDSGCSTIKKTSQDYLLETLISLDRASESEQAKNTSKSELCNVEENVEQSTEIITNSLPCEKEIFSQKTEKEPIHSLENKLLESQKEVIPSKELECILKIRSTELMQTKSEPKSDIYHMEETLEESQTVINSLDCKEKVFQEIICDETIDNLQRELFESRKEVMEFKENESILKKRIDELELAELAVKNEIREMEGTLEESKSVIDSLVYEKEVLSKKFDEEKILKMEQELCEFRQEILRYKENEYMLKKEIFELKETTSTLKRSIRDMEIALAQSRYIVDSLKHEKEGLLKKTDDLEFEFSAAQKEIQNKFKENELAGLKHELERTMKELEHVKSISKIKLNDMEEKLFQSTNIIRSLHQNNQRLSSIHSGENLELNENHHELQKLKDDFIKEITTLHGDSSRSSNTNVLKINELLDRMIKDLGNMARIVNQSKTSVNHNNVEMERDKSLTQLLKEKFEKLQGHFHSPEILTESTNENKVSLMAIQLQDKLEESEYALAKTNEELNCLKFTTMKEMQDIKAQIAQSNNIVHSLQEVNKEALCKQSDHEKIQKLLSVLLEARDEIITLNRKLKESQNLFEKTTEEFELSKSAAKKEMLNMKENLIQLNTALTCELNRRSEELELVKFTSNKKINEVEKKLTESNNVITSLQQEIQDLSRNCENEEIQQLQFELLEAYHQIRRLKGDFLNKDGALQVDGNRSSNTSILVRKEWLDRMVKDLENLAEVVSQSKNATNPHIGGFGEDKHLSQLLKEKFEQLQEQFRQTDVSTKTVKENEENLLVMQLQDTFEESEYALEKVDAESTSFTSTTRNEIQDVEVHIVDSKNIISAFPEEHRAAFHDQTDQEKIRRLQSELLEAYEEIKKLQHELRVSECKLAKTTEKHNCLIATTKRDMLDMEIRLSQSKTVISSLKEENKILSRKSDDKEKIEILEQELFEAKEKIRKLESKNSEEQEELRTDQNDKMSPVSSQPVAIASYSAIAKCDSEYLLKEACSSYVSNTLVALKSMQSSTSDKIPQTFGRYVGSTLSMSHMEDDDEEERNDHSLPKRTYSLNSCQSSFWKS